LDSSATGTVATVGGVPKTRTDLPYTDWFDSGTVFSYSDPVSSTTPGKRFDLTGVTGPTSPLTTSGTVTGTYQIQYQVTFAQSGLDSTATGTVVTIGGVSKTRADLPYTDWFNSGTTYSYSDQISTSDVHKTFERTSLSGQSSPISTTGTVTGIYGRLILRPESSGQSAQCGRTGASANWDCVDESSSDGTSTYVYGDDNDDYQYDYYNIPNVGSMTGTITSVTVKIVAIATTQNSGQDVRAQTTIYYSGNYRDGTDNALTTNWVTYSDSFTKPGGGSWTFSNIDSLQIGVGLQSHDSSGTWREARATQVWVEINFTPS
jgi:hypothetical protein